MHCPPFWQAGEQVAERLSSNQKSPNFSVALPTGTIGGLGQPCFGVDPLAVAAFNVGNTTAIWELESSHAHGIAHTEMKVIFWDP